MPKTLMLLSNPYRPDPRVFREAKVLSSAGFEVLLVAWDRDGANPRLATESGIKIARVGPRCPFRAALKVLSRLPRFWFGAMRVSSREDFDVVHCHDFDTLPLGLAISRLRGVPVLYDAHELYSKMVQREVGKLSSLVWLAESRCAAAADAVITVNEQLAKALSQRRQDKAEIVTNSPDPSVLEGVDPASTREKYFLRGFVVSYLGSLEPGRFVEELAGSFSPGSGVCVALGGNGTLRSKVERSSLHDPVVRFVGNVSTDEALRITRASDLVVSMLDPTNPNYRISTPVKVLDAMACSRPVVISEGLEMSKIVQEVGCGFVIPYERGAFLETVMNAMKSPDLLKEMGRKGKEYFDRELSWEQNSRRLLSVYRAFARAP